MKTKFRYKLQFKIYSIILIFLAINIFAQEEDNFKPYRFGIILGPNYVMNESSIPIIPGTDDCGNFSDGNTLSYFGGLNFAYKIVPDYLWLDGRLLYESRPAFLSAESNGFEVYDASSDSYVPLLREHEFDAPLQYLIFDIGAKSKPLKNIPIYARLGFDAGNPLFAADFTNEEEIVSPSNINYPDQTKRRSVESGELNSAGTALGASISLGYDLKLKSGMNVSPEITYRHGLNSIASDREWNVNILRAGVIVSWDFGGKKEDIIIEEVEEIEVEEIPEEEEEIVEVIEDPEIKAINSNKILFRETVVSQTYPLLPYMFFDSASADINAKYIHKDKLTDEGKLSKNSLEIYYYILELLGKRMSQNPNSTLTIVGVTDGQELSDSLKRNDLALKRAKNIAKYISDKYGVESRRLQIESRDMPIIPTNSKYTEGPAENRRVEFISDDPELMKPVSHVQFLEYKAQTDNINIENKISNFSDIDSVKVEILKGGNLIAQKTMDKNIFTFPIGEKLTKILGDAATKNINTNIRTTIYKDGKEIDTKIDRLDVESERDAFELIRLNLIVFDFDKSDISNTNKVMIEDFINTKITEESEVKITGSTDRLGEKEYNMRLSQQRAEAVERYIRDNKENPQISQVLGIGSSKLLFDNSLPEGRFYCRTVLIEVKTKLDAK